MNHWIFKLSLLIMLIILNVIPKTILVSVADEIISTEILPHGGSNMIDEVLVNNNNNILDSPGEKHKNHRRELLSNVIAVENDYLYPKNREMICAGLTSNQTCVTNGTELRNAIEGPCHEQSICPDDEIYLLIPRSYNLVVEKEIVIREGLTVHLHSYRGEATISSNNKISRILRVSGTLYANSINFMDGKGALHFDGGVSKGYLNHCTFVNSVDTNTNGTVILNEGELYLYDCQFSPVSNQAPIDNIGTLKQEPNYDIEYDGIDYISRL